MSPARLPLVSDPFASCTLDPAGRAERMIALRRALSGSVSGVARTGPASARITLGLDDAGERGLAGLLAREERCCAFWTFRLLRLAPGRARLDVEVPPAHVAALEALLDLARPSVGPTTPPR